MNILYIHETEYVEKVVFEYQIVPEILASRGHNVYVIDFPTKWRKNGWWDLGSLKANVTKNVRRSNKAKGITLIRPGFIKLPILSRLSAFFSYFFLIDRVIREEKIEVIVLCSVPTNGLQTLFWARRYHIPVLFRLFDILHKLVPNKSLQWPTYAMEKYVYPRVTELAAISPGVEKYAIAMGANPKTTSYIPCAADRDLFFPTPKDPVLMEKYAINPKDTVMLFAGTLYNFSGLDGLIEYLGTHQKDYPEVKLVIVGHGEQESLLRSLITKYYLEKQVILTGFINYAELASYINLADICINPFFINQITNDIIPGKIYQYLACSKPVIATRLAGMLDVFPENPAENHIYYYDDTKPYQLYGLIKDVRHTQFSDPNPSFTEITDQFEAHLTRLVQEQK